jgi:hypothetical protein
MNLNGAPPASFETSEKMPAPSYSPSRTAFASISLHQYDRMRLMQFPQEDIAALRRVIQQTWHRGIQEERPYSVSHEFKLKGYPWSGQGKDAIPARIVMREIFAYLYSNGWILHASTDISKKLSDKDTLIFRKQQTAPPPSDWFCISFNQGDRLRLIGASEELLNSFRQLLNSMGLLQNEFWKESHNNAWEFKLNGYPWLATGEETMTTRLLILNMVGTLESHGWTLYASLDQSTAGEKTSETDSWYCVRDKNWVPGMAVFHR